MKKTLLLLLFIIVLSTSVLSASVSRDMPSRVSAGDDMRVTLSVSSATAGELFTIRDQAPQGWRVDNWVVSSAEGGREGVDYQFVTADNKHGFSFTPTSANPSVSFDVKVPSTAATGDYTFNAVYFDKSGFENVGGTVNVRVIACGDSICEGSETVESCSADCNAPPPPPPPSQASNEQPEETSDSGSGASGLIIVAVIVLIGLAVYFKLKKKK